MTTPVKEARGVEGRVKEMVGKFNNGKKASTPDEAELRRREAQRAKAMAARYNMVLRGQQMMQQKMMQQRKQLSNPGNNEKHVDFHPHEFTEEWEEYPWHLAAAFEDEQDAFWMPELALALEQQDDREINKAILRLFLEENDPDRVGEIDELLTQFKGTEELLFLQLNREYNPPESSNDESAKPAVASDEIKSVGTSTVASYGEEEKTPDPSANRRRPSFVVSGMKKESGWALNAADEDLKQRMAESGASSDAVSVVVNMAAANQEPFAPGGLDTSSN